MTDKTRDFTIRKYRASDRDAVRKLCCDTGFLGNPIDPVFEDRDLFANFLTAYYTDREPESSFVLEVNGEVRGYILGSRHPTRQQVYNLYQNAALALSVLLRYWRYNAASRKFVHWILLNGWREVPAAPRRTAHFHINLLPDARNVPTTRALIEAYLGYLRDCGEKRVYGQMVTFEDRRGTKLFERYGFKVIDRMEVTKYRDLHPERVFLSTVVKDLEADHRIAGRVR
jgi:ribosomal protein S18 acetylase RimI-like enzyme